jgi:hypothetical protein
MTLLMDFSWVKNYIFFKAYFNSFMFKDRTKDFFFKFKYFDEDCIGYEIFSEGSVVKKYVYIPSIWYFKLEENEKFYFFVRAVHI